MEGNLERELKEEEERCEALKQMCEEEEKELRELDLLGEDLEVRISAVVLTEQISEFFLKIPDHDFS